MTSLCLPGRIQGETAARHFGRPRLRNLFGLLARPVRVALKSDPASRVPPFVERLWMPAYAVRLRAVSKQGDRPVWTAVEAITGEFTLFEGAGNFVLMEHEEETFPPIITETDAAQRARNGLLRYVMAQRGQINKPVVQGVEEIRPYYYPVWVCYHRRRWKYLDIKVLDGNTGKPGGAKLRIAVLHALVAARKRARSADPETV